MGLLSPPEEMCALSRMQAFLGHDTRGEDRVLFLSPPPAVTLVNPNSPFSWSLLKVTDQEAGALFTRWHPPIYLSQSPSSIPAPTL